MSASIIKYSVLLLAGSYLSMAHSNELITFGKACLEKEETLAKAEARLEKKSIRSEQSQRKTRTSIGRLQQLKEQKAQLETSMSDCESTPNSAYCHQIRHRYNELTYQIHIAEADSVEDGRYGDDPVTEFEFSQQQFNQRYDNFIAQCRDSNAHYAMIQDPEAYAAVCSTVSAKQSITCSLF